jgi:murein DD-endopeptidase MepM/ murein hydrolase activator NlpD
VTARKAVPERETLSRTFTGVFAGPPLVMSVTACAAVLALAGYRASDEPVVMFHEIVAAHSSVSGQAFTSAVAKIESARASAESDGEAQMPAPGVRVAIGKVFVSLPLAVRLAHVPQPVVSQLADAIDRDLALRSAIPSGAEFRLAYAQPDDADADSGYQLLALQIEGRDRWHDSYYFADRNGGGFFDRSGHRTGRIRNRFPVQFSRISSGFTEARFHPVLNVMRPHYGVDFAAPVGTPVRAVARGRVLKAGWQGGNGRFVKIEHHAGIATGYAHLVRIVPGLHPGARVRRGQVIGYVGASGLATGSHLHFVVYRDGHYVDPLHVSFPGAVALRGERLRAFRSTLAELDEVMAGPFRAEPIRTALVVN